ARGQSELLEGLLDQARGLDFFEAELRMAPDRFAQSDDLVAALVDRLVDPLLQLVLGHVSSPFPGDVDDILLPVDCPAPAYWRESNHSDQRGTWAFCARSSPGSPWTSITSSRRRASWCWAWSSIRTRDAGATAAPGSIPERAASWRVSSSGC